MSGSHHHSPSDGIVRHEPWYDHERNFVKVCHCEQCVHHGQADAIMDRLREYFRNQGMQLVACPSVGLCSQGNNIVVNDEIVIVRTLDNLEERIAQVLAKQKSAPKPVGRKAIKVCFGPTCGRFQAFNLEKNIKQAFNQRPDLRIVRCGCTGNCARANNIVVAGQVLHRQNPHSVVQNIQTQLNKARVQHLRQTGPISYEETKEILGF